MWRKNAVTKFINEEIKNLRFDSSIIEKTNIMFDEDKLNITIIINDPKLIMDCLVSESAISDFLYYIRIKTDEMVKKLKLGEMVFKRDFLVQMVWVDSDGKEICCREAGGGKKNT